MKLRPVSNTNRYTLRDNSNHNIRTKNINDGQKIFSKSNCLENKVHLEKNKNNNKLNEVSYVEKKLSQLLSVKSQVENEILRLPMKQKNLHQINKKILLDEEINNIENEVNNLRIRLKTIKY